MNIIGDFSLCYFQTICKELEEQKGIHFNFVRMNISPFLYKLRHLDQEIEKPDIIFIAQDMVSLEEASLSEVPSKFSHYMSQNIWNSMKYKGIQRGVSYVQGNHAALFYNKDFFKEVPKSWNEIQDSSIHIFYLR